MNKNMGFVYEELYPIYLNVRSDIDKIIVQKIKDVIYHSEDIPDISMWLSAGKLFVARIICLENFGAKNEAKELANTIIKSADTFNNEMTNCDEEDNPYETLSFGVIIDKIKKWLESK